MFYSLHLLQWGRINSNHTPSLLHISGKTMGHGRAILGKLFSRAGELRKISPKASPGSPVVVVEGPPRQLGSPINLSSPRSAFIKDLDSDDDKEMLEILLPIEDKYTPPDGDVPMMTPPSSLTTLPSNFQSPVPALQSPFRSPEAAPPRRSTRTAGNRVLYK
ncbi:hypothetical protein MVEN_01041700 [Mycena venus]|uniref:Uncharacterized protein n=1 Tax=Mycena venus TaxID=2733690 RepID=A0A8H6YEY2_9AGAR|nr:hypothetical protein MVEN_01041700 [Mycena venus]